MSSEPVKSVEIDCPISPYSHHHIHQQHHPHHHHHVLSCHHPQNHQNHPRLESPNQIKTKEEEDIRKEDDELVVEEIEKIRCLAHNKLNDCNERIRCKSTQLRHQTIEQNEQNIDDLSGRFLTGTCSGLTSGQVSISDASDRYELATSTIASSTSTSPTSLHSSSPPSSSSSDSSSSIEDGEDDDINEDHEVDESDGGEQVDDDEYAEDEDDEELVSSDGEDDVEETGDDSDEDDCEDIVDPVGNHQTHSNAGCNESVMVATDCSEVTRATNSVVNPIDEQISGGEGGDDDDEEDDDDEDDDDVSFDENDYSDDTTDQTPRQSTDLLDSERMLEVTRKLVRSTERDPDRDLRKQVLLKTAIKKLPHFMEYNHYSDSFDQSFQLHSANMSCNNNDGNNVSVNCLSTVQYYEHQHHLHMNHNIDSQPKSYYHSVQPNAIQMSTTSLRMLDLNDDQEAEQNTIIDNDPNQQHLNHHLGVYGTNNENNVQTSLEQQQPNDYANHSQQPTLNMYHYAHHATENQHHQHSNNDMMKTDDDEQRAIQELTASPFTQEPETNMIAHHGTVVDNLYQPTSDDIIVGDGSRAVDRQAPVTFPVNYVSMSHIGTGPENKEDTDCLSETKTFNNLDDPNGALDQSGSPAISLLNNTSEQLQSNHDCIQEDPTTADAYFCSGIEARKPMKEIELKCVSPILSLENGIVNESILSESELVRDQSSLLSSSDNSDGNSNSSSHSSTSSDDGFSISSKPNDLTDENMGIAPLLNTSLNSTNDYHHSSHDSGVALYSPRSNKRSSSSIGLDDEMEIDHLGDLISMSQQGSNSGTNMNHCKKLRKRETLD